MALVKIKSTFVINSTISWIYDWYASILSNILLNTRIIKSFICILTHDIDLHSSVISVFIIESFAAVCGDKNRLSNSFNRNVEVVVPSSLDIYFRRTPFSISSLLVVLFTSPFRLLHLRFVATRLKLFFSVSCNFT